MTLSAELKTMAAGPGAVAARAFEWWLSELRGACRVAARGFAAGTTVTVEAGERQWIVRRRQRVLGQVDRAAGDALNSREALVAIVTAARCRRPPRRRSGLRRGLPLR